MRISGRVDIELPPAGSVGDDEVEAFLQYIDDEFFGANFRTNVWAQRVAEALRSRNEDALRNTTLNVVFDNSAQGEEEWKP